MKSLGALIALVLAIPLLAGPVHAQSVDEQIAQAVAPLPEDLQAGATVYTYDAETGARKVLRQGTNQVECRPKNDVGETWCYSVSSSGRRDLSAKLRAEGKSGEELQAAFAAAAEAGTIEPSPFGAMMYRAYDKPDKIQLLHVVTLPNATAEEMGMSTTSQRDPGLAGQGRPWMMRAGTPGAHLMIPINQTELSSKGGATTRTDTKAIDDPVAQAVLPLPADLRADASVVTYDADTGAWKVLRQGTNMIECQPRGADGFTRCYNKSTAPRRDLVAKLRAEGKSGEELQAAVAAAREAGTIKPTPFGSLSYRLWEDDDRIKLLWVMALPNATSEQLGMTTGSQRDNSLAGKGMPWMMREGTPGAHLMIPINGTELSNKK